MKTVGVQEFGFFLFFFRGGAGGGGDYRLIKSVIFF